MGIGKLEVITGPMTAGKTTALIGRLRSFDVAELSYNVYVPAFSFRDIADVDTSEYYVVETHNGDSYPCIPLENYEVLKLKEDTSSDVIVIDEVQLFDDFIVGTLREILLRGQNILAAGLNKDRKLVPFKTMSKLLGMADDIVYLKGVCDVCKRMGAATLTKYIGDQEDNNQVLVGGTDVYEARCAECWDK